MQGSDSTTAMFPTDWLTSQPQLPCHLEQSQAPGSDNAETTDPAV